MKPFDGDLDDYRRLILAGGGAPGMDVGSADKSRAPKRPDKAEIRRSAAEKRIELAPIRRRIAELEKELGRLTQEIARLDSVLAEPGLFARDATKAASFAKLRADNAAALARTEEEWFEASAAFEAAMA